MSAKGREELLISVIVRAGAVRQSDYPGLQYEPALPVFPADLSENAPGPLDHGSVESNMSICLLLLHLGNTYASTACTGAQENR